jgi:hypothetical protein
MVVAICNICNRVLDLKEVDDHFKFFHKEEKKKSYRLENGVIFEYKVDTPVLGTVGTTHRLWIRNGFVDRI